MRFGTLAALAALAAGCSSSVLGECKTTCGPGTVCDPGQHVCVVPNGGCFPACAGGKVCISAACQSSICNPACNSSEACDPATVTCKPVGTASVAITSPAANSFAGLSLQVTADARAPGGVNGVEFQLRPANSSGLGTAAQVLARGPGVATTPGGANFAGVIPLNSGTIPDGPVDLVAVMTYPTGSATSAALPVKVDLTPPSFSAGSVTPAWVGPQALDATVTVGITDSGAGVDPAKVFLTLTGVAHAPYLASAANGNVYTFTVPMTDLGIPDGAQGPVNFKIDASDLVGNQAASYSGQPFEVIQVDRVKPLLSVTVDPIPKWYAASQTATVQGTASDAQSGLSGGAAGVRLTGGTFNQAGTINNSNGTFSISADLSTQTFGATEAPFPITVTLTDAAGNTATQAGNINVDNKPPTISAITVPTGDCPASSCGQDFFKAGTGTVTITATIQDLGIGVDTATVFLQPAATGANTGFTKVAGTPGSTADTWNFALPRSVGNGLDGSVPVQFVIVANDKLASTAIPDAANHKGSAGPVSILFDDTPPVITPAVDAKWYVRKALGGNVITVHATVVDKGAGVSGATLTVLDANNGNTPHTFSGVCNPSTGDCVFAGANGLDTAYALVNKEQPLQYTLTAQDRLWTSASDAKHTSSVVDSRNVDGLPPTVTITRIYNANRPTASTGQISYPDNVNNTGYNANHFIYSDTLTITGTIQDQGAGIAVNGAATPPTPNFEVDGTAVGPKFAITSCSDGTTAVCNFTATVKLNDPTQAGPFAQSDSTMQVVVNSSDKALNADGTLNGNQGSSPALTFNVTRFWWKNLVSAANVSGLGVFPSGGANGVGDVVATVAASAGDSVFSLYRTGPLHSGGAIAWSKGAAFYTGPADLGSVQAAPAIGAAATNPNIYIGTAAGDVVAFTGVGATAWNCASANGTSALIDPVRNAPAIVQASKVGAQSSCEAVVAGTDNSNLWAVCGTTPNACNARSVPIAATGASPAISLANNYYVAAGHSVAQATLNGTGGFLPANTFATTDTNVINNILTDGSELYALNNNAQKAYAFDSSRATRYSKTLANAVNGAPLLLPATAPSPGLLFNENNFSPSNSLYTLGLTTATPAETGVAALAKAASTTTAPLLGSDNRIYTDGGGSIYALNQKTPPFTTDWSYSIGTTATFNGPLTMDCGGVLYAASGGTVYAFVTDARGLGNSPWPKYQRDSRNSGNADAATLWGANVSGTCTQ